MSDDERTDDLEWRLHALLTERAEAVHSYLDGPTLRARAETPRSSRRFPIPAVVSAALVSAAAAAIVAATVTAGGPDRRPQPGGGITVGPSPVITSPTPVIPSSPTTSPRIPVRGAAPMSTPTANPSQSTPPAASISGAPPSAPRVNASVARTSPGRSPQAPVAGTP